MNFLKNKKLTNISILLVLIVMFYMPFIMRLFNKYSMPLLLIVAAILIHSYDIYKKRKSLKNVLFVVLGLIVLIPSLYNNAYILDGKFGIYLYYIFSILYASFAYLSVIKKKNVDFIFNLLILFSLITSVVTWISVFFPDFYVSKIITLLPIDSQATVANDFLQYGAKAGLTDHYSRNAFFMILGIFGSFYFMKTDKKKCLPLLIYYFFTLIFIGKRGHFIFLILSVMIAYFIFNKISKENLIKLAKWFCIILVAVLVVGIVFPESSNLLSRLLNFDDISNGRFRLYNRAISLAKKTFPLPIGWGQFVKDLNYVFAGVHNDYLQILCETGLLGFVMIIGVNIFMLTTSIKYAKREKSNLSYIILVYNLFYLLYSLTGLPHYDFETNIIYYLFNAILFSLLSKEDEQKGFFAVFNRTLTKEEKIKEVRTTLIYRFLISIKHRLEYIYYYFIYYFKTKDSYNILDDNETVDKIVKDRISIARYGDGEFKWILGIKQINFQDDNEEMKRRLTEVLVENNPKLLVGIPKLINDSSDITYEAKRYWIKFLAKTYDNIKPYLDSNKIYCDAYITRPYMDRIDKSFETTKKRYDNLKRIWKDKEIVIVEGEFSRLGLNNDLFDDAKSIERIICPASNAYNKYDEILSAIKKQSKKKMYILSLGPTATILADDLSKDGYHAIDLGHIDIEYMWFNNRSTKKETVYGKFVNEVTDNGEIADIVDDNYKNQIIAVIK